MWHIASLSGLRLIRVGTHRSVQSTLRRCIGDAAPGSIYYPPSYVFPVSSKIAECIRGRLDDNSDENRDASNDTGMKVLCLGTSAGLPTKARSPTSTLVRLGGESILVDAGEGTQRQLTFVRSRPGQIDKILITHLHGDHIFGLPGLLLGLQHTQYLSQGVKTAPRVIKIYGPPGIYNYIASNIILSCTVIHAVDIQVFELVGSRVRRIHGTRDVRNPFEDNYPEFHFGRMTRHQIPRGEDGVWTLQDIPSVLTREDIMTKKESRSRHTLSGDKSRFRIQAAEVDHLSGVVTFGYSIQEEEPPLNLDAAKAKELGVSSQGHKYNLLKAGFSVWTDDGARQVEPSEVCTQRRKKARKITLVGDNRGWTPAMKRIGQNSDVLVHEATLMGKDINWRKRGHSTADMAGKISGEINAKLLVLNHISPKADYLDQDDASSGQLELIEKAQAASKGISEVVVGYDFMEISVPWLGFGGVDATQDLKEKCNDTTLIESKNESLDTKQLLKTWFDVKET